MRQTEREQNQIPPLSPPAPSPVFIVGEKNGTFSLSKTLGKEGMVICPPPFPPLLSTPTNPFLAILLP